MLLQRFQQTFSALMLTCLIIGVFFVTALTVTAQTSDDAAKSQAIELIKQQKFTEALPLLEKLVVSQPEDGETQFYYGFALLGKSKTIKDKAQQTQLNIRARKSFIKAKELGVRDNILDALIASIPEDGVMKGKFSSDDQAEELMNEGESFFSQGKLDEALKAYQKALSLDPKIYYAALFSGDVYTQKQDYANAEVWYQKAIVIDPNRETAYRYSATPLMKQKKYNLARDRYIEAYIVEPYSKFATAGISNWAEVTQTQIGHPRIDIPTDVETDEKGNTKINLSAEALLGGATGDGSTAWIIYGATRSIWRKEKFAQTYPKEAGYRHTLAEEADALQSVLAMVEADLKNKKIKTLNPSLAKLKKLNDAGCLESYILLARPDGGIAQDYAEYLRQNRDKLRRYVVEFVVSEGK